MKPINKVYNITAPDANMTPIMLNVDCVQQQININAVLSGSATYAIQGNLGMVNTKLAEYGNTAGLGQIIPDPDGWFQMIAPATASKQTGNGLLTNFLPVAFIRPVVTVGTSATLTLNVLQQAVR